MAFETPGNQADRVLIESWVEFPISDMLPEEQWSDYTWTRKKDLTGASCNAAARCATDLQEPTTSWYVVPCCIPLWTLRFDHIAGGINEAERGLYKQRRET